jgi:hypothetical protein
VTSGCKRNASAGDPAAEQLATAPLGAPARCNAIRTGLQRGVISDADATWLGGENVRTHEPTPALVKRIAARTLTPADLGIEGGDFPPPHTCDDLVFDALAHALATSPAPWADPSQLSTSMRLAIAKEGMSEPARAALSTSVDAAAKANANKDTLDDLAPAKHLCELAEEMKAKVEASCMGVEQKHARLAAAKEAKARAHEEECAPKLAAAKRCLDSCEDFNDEPCEARCKKRFPITGCE